MLTNPGQSVSAVQAQSLDILEGSCQLQAATDTSMNTIRRGNIAKTIHAEKNVWRCLLEQGNLPVILDITTFIEIFTNISDESMVFQSLAVACLKDPITVQVLDCASGVPSTDVVFRTNCSEGTFTHAQEMNTVNKGEQILTVEAQKESFFLCTTFEGRLDTVHVSI